MQDNSEQHFPLVGGHNEKASSLSALAEHRTADPELWDIVKPWMRNTAPLPPVRCDADNDGSLAEPKSSARSRTIAVEG